NKLVFTLKVETFTGGVPPAETRWPVQFVINGGTTTGYWVDMSTRVSDGGTPAAPVFRYGTFNPTGGTGGTYGAPTTVVGNADASSAFSADGTITMVVPRSAVGNPGIGDNITGFLIRVRAEVPVVGAITPDNMPDSLAPSGTYGVAGNDSCAPNTPPIAALAAYPVGSPPGTPPQGDPPLAIHFDASGSSDPDPGDTVVSYSFDFGDGSPPVTQASSMIEHTYTSNGHYAARLTVTDNHGAVSSNVAVVEIEVELPLDDVVSRKTHGSAGDFNIDLLKPDGTADIECRAQGSAYTIIYSFGSGSEFTVTGQASNATITNGGTVAGHGPGSAANQYSVTLTTVPNAQRHVVTLNGVPVHNNNISGNGGNATLNNVPAQFNLLVGDTNNNATVNAADISQTKAQSGNPVASSNFRQDVNANGAINGADISQVKAQSGTGLP
ncbi:MAG: PKD domain-containing protein, partial [Chthoniobacterales bacterium]